MSIGPVGTTSPLTLIPATTTPPTTEELLPDEIIAPSEPTGIAATDEESEGSDKMKGVLRNLMAGHFKGVADVRLRLNFATEIAALEEAAAQEASASAIPVFQEAVSAAVSEVASSELLTEEQATSVGELQTALEAAVATQAESALAAESLDIQSFADQMTTTFEAFSASLSEALTVDAAVPDDLQTLIDDLGGALTQAIADLTAAADTASLLPEVSEPSGNGRAFAKFMAQYEALSAPTTPDAQPTSTENVETVA